MAWSVQVPKQQMKGSLEEQLVHRYTAPGLIAAKASQEMVGRHTRDRLPLLSRLQRRASIGRATHAVGLMSMPYVLRFYDPGGALLSRSLERTADAGTRCCRCTVVRPTSACHGFRATHRSRTGVARTARYPITRCSRSHGPE